MKLIYTLFAAAVLTACASTANRKPNQIAPAEGTAAVAPTTKTPKYASTTVTLSRDHEYLARRKHDAPDFWALIGYYVPQEEHACSAASVTMMLNAFRSTTDLSASDELIRQRPLIEKTASKEWADAIASGNCLGLDALTGVLKQALTAQGFIGYNVANQHIEDTSDATRKLVHNALVENEKSAKDFIIANFVQGIFTGDPEGMVGHMSLVGAYDAHAKRVLILDVDRQWYEPYWVSEETFIKGMNTRDEGNKAYRGFIRVSAQ